jgi:uncharacterized membrane protein (DUF4010 family)
MNLSYALLFELAHALGIGVLIGLERSLGARPRTCDRLDEENDDPVESELIGVRTFTVLSLFGYSGALANDIFAYVAPVVLAGVTVLVLALYIRNREVGGGITTEAAAISTCALGMLCHGQPNLAGVLALVMTVMLASKRFTRSAIRKMRRVELTGTLKFLVIIFIVLPLLPDRPLDPFGVFNPYKVGLLVVLISGISFVGYFLTRFLGAQRGLGLTGVLGGLTSSTAVTAAMAVEARQHQELRNICAFSTVAANATMFARVIVVVLVLDRVLAMRLAWSVGTMAFAASVAAGLLWLAAGRDKTATAEGAGEVQLRNPFSLGPAISFAAFFVVILFVVKLATVYFGDQGLLAAAALSGLADVDAITLSIAEQTNSDALTTRTGAIAVTIAVVSNSIVKSGIAFYSGGIAFGRTVTLSLGMATVLGLTVALLL